MQSGTYVITYTATDACGNSTTLTRDVIVSLPVADDFGVSSGNTSWSDEAPAQVYDVFSDPGFDFSWYYYNVYTDEFVAYAYFDNVQGPPTNPIKLLSLGNFTTVTLIASN